MKRGKRRSYRSEPEIRALVAGYEKGNQSRAAYCAAHGLSPNTLDSYRRRLRTGRESLVEIDLHTTGTALENTGSVTVVLRNGRRVEIGWADLALAPEHSRPLRAFLGWLEEA